MRYFIGILAVFAVFAVPHVFASCIVNEDWPNAPCLDSIGNGYYEQDDVDRWAQYYDYKGKEFMEQKRAEMNDAIKNNTLKEWVAESIQNENVYSYYFFSGRAPDVGIYRGQFEEFGVWENPAIHEPFDNSDMVLVGTVVQVTITPENKTRYDFKVDEYLKGEKPFDLITATLDDTKSADFPKDPLDYFNKPYFEKDNQVFVYLKQDGSTFQVSPYSFTIKKPTTAGPPSVIHPTGPHQHIISQGEEIVISGTIKKSYLYSLEKSNLDSSFDLVVLNEDEEKVEAKKLDINLDGSYSFTFQEKNQLRIPGKYSWKITYHNGEMGGEFIVKTDQKLWTPLKQFHTGVPYEETQCKQNLLLVQKYDGTPACVTESTKQKLIERDWIKVWEPGPESGGAIHVPERMYDARLVMEYREAFPVTHTNNVTNDQLKDNLEIIRNAGLRIVSSGIDYDIGRLVLYSDDLTIKEEIKQVLGDFPFVLLYEDTPGRWIHGDPQPEPDPNPVPEPDCNDGKCTCPPDWIYSNVSKGCEIKRTMPPEPPLEDKEPTTEIELMFGNRLDDGLLPIKITEITANANSLDEITVWNFEPIGHSGADRRVVWDTLPEDNQTWYEIVDDNFIDIRDYERKNSIMIPLDLHTYQMNCGLFDTVEAESAHPTTVPIKKGANSVHAQISRIGIYPDSDGKYLLEFGSIFPHSVRFSDNTYDSVEILHHETKECDAKWQIDGKSDMEHGDGYYTKIGFRFLDDE